MHLIFFNVFRNSEANASVFVKLPRYYIRGDVFSMIITNWHITRSERVKTCYRSTRIQCVVLICTDAIIQQVYDHKVTLRYKLIHIHETRTNLFMIKRESSYRFLLCICHSQICHSTVYDSCIESKLAK